MNTNTRVTIWVRALAVVLCIGGCTTPGTMRSSPEKPAGPSATPIPKRDLIEAKLEEAKAKGMEIIHNATLIPAASYAGARVIMGSEMREFDGVTYYNDLSNKLDIGFGPKGQEYLGGRGIAIWKGKVYCLGF